ncbi:MAG TPA: hypothetical protein EYO59_01335, partial [Chromatiaceae bacterium]|nr:hypothetical protein [Chromatiaceae bacterium]
MVNDNGTALEGWQIPVVILGVFQANEEGSNNNLLEVVRKIFIYINSEAKMINPARKILLDDESVNAICTQILVQEAHENDCRPLDDRDRDKMPLLFYDWRGATSGDAPVHSPAALHPITEVNSWFEWYILGPDGEPEQQLALQL